MWCMDDRAYRTWAAELAISLGRFPELSAAQRKDALRRIANLCGSTTQQLERLASEPSRADQDVAEDWLLNGMLMDLRKRGLSGPTKVILSGRSGKQYTAAASEVRAVLEDILGPSAKQPLVRLVMAKIVVMCLYRRFERLNIDATPGMILGSIAYAREALELGFPGYIDSKLFPLVLSQWLDANQKSAA